MTLSNIDKICPLAISFISMHEPSLVKTPWHLLKLSSGNENMGVARADNSVQIWRNLPISNPKPDLYHINAHTKFGENPSMFIQVIIRKRNTDGRMYDWRTDRHTDVQFEIKIPRHYRVAGHKNLNMQKLQHNLCECKNLRSVCMFIFILWWRRYSSSRNSKLFFSLHIPIWRNFVFRKQIENASCLPDRVINHASYYIRCVCAKIKKKKNKQKNSISMHITF